MAEGFLTGVSSTPLDISSGARALSRTALETRLGEIAASQEQISENKKNVLKALSINALPELARAQRDRYQKEIQDYRQSVIDKFKSSGGKLTLQQETEIQDGFVDMQNRMQQEVNELKQFQDFQKITTNPAARGLYDMNKLDEIAGSTYKNLMEGKGIGDLTAKLAGAIREQNPADYISKFYAQNVKGLDIESIARQKNKNSYEITEGEVAQEVDKLLDYVQQNDPNMNRVLSDANQRQVAKDALIREATKQMKGSLYETGSDGSSPYKNAVDYTPSEFTYKNKKWNIVSTPSDVTQTDRNFFINKATNVDTGETAQMTQDNAKIVGIDVDNGVIILEGKGGKAKTGDQLMYHLEGQPAPTKDGKYWNNATAESQLRKEETQRTMLSGSEEATKFGVKAKDVVVDSVDITEDGFTIKGHATVSSGFFGTKKQPVQLEVKGNTFTDPTSQAIYEAPLYENKPAVSSWFKKATIKGKPIPYYFDNKPTVPELNKEELLREGYSESQINEAVKAGKIRLK